MIEIDESVGVSAARNAGAAASTAPLLLWCDDDDEASDRWVSGMICALEHADLVGGPLDIAAPGPEWTKQFAPSQREGLSRDGPRRRGTLGASLGATRVLWERCGGFDERFVAGSDDTAFVFRAQAVGARLGFASEARLTYRLRSTYREIMHQRASYARSRALFTRLYEPPAATKGRSFEWLRAVASTRYLLRSRSLDDLRVETLMLWARFHYASAFTRVVADTGATPDIWRQHLMFTLSERVPHVGGLSFWAPPDRAAGFARSVTVADIDDAVGCATQARADRHLVVIGGSVGVEALAVHQATGLPITVIEPDDRHAEAATTNLGLHRTGSPVTVSCSRDLHATLASLPVAPRVLASDIADPSQLPPDVRGWSTAHVAGRWQLLLSHE